MILDASTKLEAVLAGAVSANQPEVHVDYIDWNKDGAPTRPASFRVALNSNTDVTILAAPVQNPIREILRIDLYNKDTASITVTIKTDDGTERIMCKVVLLTLESLHFEKDRGLYALDANGNEKMAPGPISSANVLGTTTNDNAAAGRLGEYIESVIGATNFPTSTNLGDLTSISLTAGDWDVSALLVATANSATVTTFEGGISTTSGNSGTGLVIGSNRILQAGPVHSVNLASVSIPNYRMSLSATTTVYFKYSATYSVATPQGEGRISARRVR